MNARTIAYWVTTALVSVAFLGSGAAKLAGAAELVENVARLGYPRYLLTILGLWMVAAPPVLLAPKLPLMKEWAYAGVIFAMTGAFASHLFAGDPIGKALPPLVLAGLAVASYVLRPASRRLAG